MSRFDSFCASCGYQLTKDGDGWTGCQCAKLAELEERGVNIVDLDEENTRLRAALESIAALQTEAPADTSEETGERFDSLRDAYECGEMDGYRDGQWEASEMARKALVSK